MYPPAPWTLQGHALQTLQPVSVERARLGIPPELQIVQLWPGLTLGGVYLATYGPGSALEYHELIVVSALVRQALRVGFWISHIYVDNPDSVAGGREIWGLPKELAQFTWEPGNVQVARQGQRLCTLTWAQQRWSWPQQLAVPSFSTLGADLLVFQGKASARVGPVSAELTVPAESPFAGLELGHPWLAFECASLTLVADVPQAVGSTRQPRTVDLLV